MYTLRIAGSPLSVAFLFISDAISAARAILPAGYWLESGPGAWSLRSDGQETARITHDSP